MQWMNLKIVRFGIRVATVAFHFEKTVFLSLCFDYYTMKNYFCQGFFLLFTFLLPFLRHRKAKRRARLEARRRSPRQAGETE